MPAKENDSQNVWFGVSMFLLGIIAGAVLTAATGNIQLGKGDRGATASSAPTAPTAPSAPTPDVNDRMVAYAEAIGIDKSDFQNCMNNDAAALQAKINQETTEGQASGVNGTPGNILYDLRSKKARLVSGAQPVANFEKNIDAMLADANAKVTDQSAQEVSTVVPVDFDKDHVIGSRDAKIAIIEYTDYQCPFCHAVHTTHQQLLKKYDGKVVWVMRHFPLSFHPEAMPLATGAECAAKLKGNDAFWAFTDKVMSE